MHGDQATPIGGTHDHPTQAWPEIVPDDRDPAGARRRPRRHPRVPEPDKTRLDLDAMSSGGALAEPTIALPAVQAAELPTWMTQARVPADVPAADPLAAGIFGARPALVERTEPQPVVKAIPTHAPRTPYRPGAPVVSSQPAIVGDLEAAPSAPAWRPRGGPRMRGIFGWVPTAPPSLREAAEARVRVAEREQQRKLRHARHVDALEVVRAYLGVTVLIALLVLVGAMAVIAFGILSGWYTWSPVHR